MEVANQTLNEALVGVTNGQIEIAKDIRQISSYARDKGVLNKLGISDEDTVVNCLIIYPNMDATKEFKNRLFATRIPELYKIL